ncbi:uncharacterized protein [Ptychodera flava]|uniref:uncharacterized protein n=1 Tax=Ptychodera flava TaxID=63121 RepID=UPI003969D5D7
MMATGEQFGARGGGDGTEEIPEILPLPVVTISDDGGEDDGVDEPSPPYTSTLTTTRPIECRQYKLGTCKEADKCGPNRHPHRTFPSSPLKWENQHIQRLRFVCHSFNLPQGLSFQRVVCHWLFSDESCQLRDQGQHGDNESDINSVQHDLKHLAVGTTKTACSVKQRLQEDTFLHLLSSFVAKYNLETDNVTVLNEAVNTAEFLHNSVVPCVVHRRVLLTWLDVCNRSTNGKCSESRLVDLIADIINSASYETDCLVTLKIRESTAHSISVCGHPVVLQSDIEVCGPNGDTIVQVVTSTENAVFSRRADLDEILPVMASEALAVAKETPFGSLVYKTVYQIFVHTTCSPSGETEQVCAYLVRCHVACETLGRMADCPIPNPLKRSYIFYEQIPCVNIYYETLVSTLYQAVKALFVMFKERGK